VKYVIPLLWILAELRGVKSITSKWVQNEYQAVVQKLGSEFEVLLDKPVEEIREAGFEDLAMAVDKMRKGEVEIKPGYDGVYGVVQIGGIKDVDLIGDKNQLGLF
jgi:PHP family Zn ribbon phosphoesterase